MRTRTLVFVVVGITASVSGCALTSKGDALAIRWFTPESATVHLTSAPMMPSKPPVAIELGRVSAGGHLRERIAYRDGAFEVGYYDDKRWTERPEIYVRRAVARTLFEDRGFEQVVGAPILDVEVLAFEEVIRPVHAARVELRMVLHDATAAKTLIERTLTVERSVAPGQGMIGLVQAISQALDAAAAQIATLAERAAISASSATTGGEGEERAAR